MYKSDDAFRIIDILWKGGYEGAAGGSVKYKNLFMQIYVFL